MIRHDQKPLAKSGSHVTLKHCRRKFLPARNSAIESGPVGRRRTAHAQAQPFQLLLHGMVPRRFLVDSSWGGAIQFQRRRHHFPAIAAAMDLESMLDEFAALLLRARDRYKDPFVRLQSLQRFHFSVRDRDRVGVIIHRLHPRLFTHDFAGVVQKSPKLVCANDLVHGQMVAPDDTKLNSISTL